MKTSIKLLCLLAFITLSGMLSVDGLLKQQYDRIDWSNPYQDFTAQPLPTLKHVRILGTPDYSEIRIQQGAKPQALIDRQKHTNTSAVEITQKGDTLLVLFHKKGSGWDGPINKDWNFYHTALVLNLPALSSLYMNNVRATISGFETNQLHLTAHHALLKTEKIRIAGLLTVQTENQAFAILGGDLCGTLQATVRDSSGVELERIAPNQLITNVAPRAELRLKGNQLRAMKD